MKPSLTLLLWVLLLSSLMSPLHAEDCAPWPPLSEAQSAAGADAPAIEGGAPGAGYEFDYWTCDRPLAEAPFLELGRDAEPWLPRFIDVLDGNRPPHYVPEVVALLKGSQRDPYLIVTWEHDGPGPTRYSPLWPLELHRVIRTPDGGRRLKWVRRYRAEAVELRAPTGHALVPGGPPIAVLQLYVGGSTVWSTKLHLIEMTRNTVDITPDWAGRLIDVVDLDGDGAYEVVVHDPKWLVSLYDRVPEYLFLPAILARRGSRFVYACQDFPGAFDDFIDASLARGRHPLWAEPNRNTGQLSQAIFAYLQIGAFEKARSVLDELDAAVARSLRIFGEGDSLGRARTVGQVRKDHEHVIEQARRRAGSGCPASAPGIPAGPHGALLLLADLQAKWQSGDD